MRKINYKRYYADFETTKPNELNQVRVYIWALTSFNNNLIEYGETIESFVDYILKLKYSYIYFRNGSGFDFKFIIPYLLQNDIKFKTLEKMGTIYQLEIKNVKLRDSMLLLPMSLKEACNNFNTNYFKTSIDYDVPYEHNATWEEVKYCINDVLCDSEATENFLKEIKELCDSEGWTKSSKKIYDKMTISGIAFECFKESSFYEKCCENRILPYSFLRKAYYGGFVYSSCKMIESNNLKMEDNNSMYPFVYSSALLPVGNATLVDDEKDLKNYDLYVIRVYICFELRDGYVPIIPKDRLFKSCNNNYMKSSDGDYIELTLTCWDFERIKKYYICDYQFISAYGFMAQPNFYKKYADRLIKIKNESLGAKRYVSKILLNSPYGKLALNTQEEETTYSLDENGYLKREVVIVKDEEQSNYLAQALFITAGARKVLFDRAELIGWNNILYTDTDSIKYDDIKNLNLETDSKTLGAWKNEGKPKFFKTTAPKRYIYYEENKLYIKCAGFKLYDLLYQLCLKIGLSDDYILNNIDMKSKDNIVIDYDKALLIASLFKSGLKIKHLQKRRALNGVYLEIIEKEMS